MNIGVIGAYNKTDYYYKKAQNKNSDGFCDSASKAAQEQAGYDNDKPVAKLFNVFNPYISYKSKDNDAENTENLSEGNNDMAEFTDYAAVIRAKVEQMREKLENGEVEPKFQIGALCLTEKQWDKLMDKMDSFLEQIHEEIKEETEKIRKEAAEKKADEAARQLNTLTELLNSETVRYENTAENGKKEFYITCFLKDGIYCKAPGQDGFLWHIKLEDGDYERVIDFINRFDKRSNLSFAPNQSFWNDFLNGRIDENDFEADYKNAYTDSVNKVSSYSGYDIIDNNITDEETDKAGWFLAESKYFTEYFTEFAHSLHGSTASEENVENLSHKYNELYESINKSDLDEDEKNERIKVLDGTFKMMMKTALSNDAFIAKSNQIHDYLVAYISKDIIANPDKQKHNRILENNRQTMEYLSNLDAMLRSYADMYCESFMDYIKGGKSAAKSIEAGFSRLREDSSLSMSYDDAKAKAEDLSEKMTEIYKYI